jgi:hypothetical protein
MQLVSSVIGLFYAANLELPSMTFILKSSAQTLASAPPSEWPVIKICAGRNFATRILMTSLITICHKMALA